MTIADRFDPQAVRELALGELSRAPERVYLDEPAEIAAADAYYRDVDATSLQELTALLTQTHHSRPAYAPAVQLYPWVDLQPDLSLTSLYTGQRYDPAELIERDLDVARARHAESRRIANERHADPGSADDLLDESLEESLEEALLYNCEHSVPQSWFGKKEPMRGDLHSLTEAQLEEEDVFKLEHVERGTFEFRVYANLTDQGVDYVWAEAADLAKIEGVAAYKFAWPESRWRRDTMVIYCKTAPAAGRVLRWFYGLQTELADPEIYFAADVPHFTTPAPLLRGVSAVKDPDSGAGTSYSQRMSEMVRTAIVTGALAVEPADPIASYAQGIVTRLNQFWGERQRMRGKPKP